tara:strand:- start:2681 stop:3259 length:579 start_codon:yes stop_codon:yes gene_type:complete
MAAYNTYPNMKILHNTPDQVIEYCNDLWENAKDVVISKSDLDTYKYLYEDEGLQMVMFHSDELNKILTDTFNIKPIGTIFLTCWANAGLDHIHIDNHRFAAINIPITVDFDNSCFFVANQECTQIASSTKQSRFDYEPERYDWCNVKKPIMFNTAAPHGFFNHSNENRVILSVSVEGTYEEAVANLPENLYS